MAFLNHAAGMKQTIHKSPLFEILLMHPLNRLRCFQQPGRAP